MRKLITVMRLDKKVPLPLFFLINRMQLLASGNELLPLRAAVHLRLRLSSCQSDSVAKSACRSKASTLSIARKLRWA
jgi:hypothetical protein